MRRLIVFNNVTVDGYFCSAQGDMSWARANRQDPELKKFIEGNASGNGELLFGRITYQMMASYWPTPLAAANDPVVAEGMNKMSKVVFSRSLEKVSWENTKLVKGDLVEEVRRMKSEPGSDMAILGSGSITAQLAQAGLIDEFQVLVNPVVLGKGRTMFDGISKTLSLKLTNSRTFPNGVVYLCYQPVG